MKLSKLLFLSLFVGVFSQAQVGVNAASVDPSAALDIQFGTTPKGLLTPRMTTAERTGIATPADGLIVFDTDLKSFYYYKTGTGAGWVRMNSDVSGRTNFKRIKSVSDLAAEKTAGGSSKYLLQANTYYEVNGAVIFDLPIDLNNAYLVGLDVNEDKLIKTTGNLFEGATGGTVKNLTVSVSGGKVFNLLGTDNTQTLLFRDNIVMNSLEVGSISKFGLVFSSVVQYVNNTKGIVYNNITRLLLSNIAWFGDNKGTFETYTGTFSLIQKQGGFCEVNGTAIGMDLSADPVISGSAVLESVGFTGDTTAGYVKRYTNGSYTGYNFNNSWSVNSPGIPREGDVVATGDINLDAVVGTGKVTTFTGTGTGSRKKLEGTTTSNNLFRFTRDGDNKIIYKGNKPRYFQVSASVSYQGSAADMTLILYIAKNGTVIENTKVYGRPSTGFFSGSGILALPIVGTVQMNKNDYIEIWGERFDGSGNMSTVSLNLTVR